MATRDKNAVPLAAVFIWNLQTCHAYCTHYGSCYGVWGMWYFWMSLIVLLVICCGAIGGYWRRRQLMHTMQRQQQGIVTVQGAGATNAAYTHEPTPVFGVTPPPYNVATKGKASEADGAPPPYSEAVPQGYEPFQAQSPNGSHPYYPTAQDQGGIPPYPVQPVGPTPPDTYPAESAASPNQGPNH